MTSDDMVGYVADRLREARELLAEAEVVLAEARGVHGRAVADGGTDLDTLWRRVGASQRRFDQCKREVERLIWAYRFCQQEG